MQQVFERLLERVAGLDVHKAQVTAAVRVPDGEGGRLQDVAEFSTTVRGLMGLRDWLEAHQVTHLAMEATGVYWRPDGRYRFSARSPTTNPPMPDAPTTNDHTTVTARAAAESAALPNSARSST